MPAATCASLAAANARVSGSGISTMPGPPPYGRSSTVRYESVAKSRGFHTPRAHNPRSRARPVTPYPDACVTMSGNSVTTSIRNIQRLIIERPVDVDAPRGDVHAIDEPLDPRDQPLATLSPRNPDDRMRTAFDEIH